MKRFIVTGMVALSLSQGLKAQGEIDVQPKIFWRNEWSIGGFLTSSGFSANYRYGLRIDARNKRLFEVDFAYVKHPKESKSTSQTSSGARFVYGKKNLAFDIRAMMGRQHEIYRKHDVGSVAIRYFYNYGISAALLKPIYYNTVKVKYIGPSPIGDQYIEVPESTAKFDPNWLNNNEYIYNRASFFKGFNGLRAVPGVFGKFGFNFEYSKKDKIIHAIECGLLVEGFLRPLDIMDFSGAPPQQTKVGKNEQVFLTIFVGYRFGKIVDPYAVKKEKKQRKRSNDISY